MKKYVIVLAAALLAVALLAPSAQAWRSVRTGQKNFQRAWSAFMFKRPDKAQGYFSKAADAFNQALAENPPSRTTMFPSNLTMAGISFYYAGQYKPCIDAMTKAMDKDDDLWEAFFFSALSYARQGDKANTIKLLTRYIKSNPALPILSSAVSKQLTDLQTDSGPLDAVAPALEEGYFDQIHNNVTLVGNNSSNSKERCNGKYWWHYNKSPCSDRKMFIN